MPRVALFTHCFLERTHYAIGDLLDASIDTVYDVWARRFGLVDGSLGLKNVCNQSLITQARLNRNSIEKCDIIHAIYDGDAVFEALEVARLLDKPFVISFHGGFDTNAKILDDRYHTKSINACNQAQAITVVGTSDKLKLQSLGIRVPIIVLPVPISPDCIPMRAPAGSEAVIVGRLVAKKGIDIAIEALSMLDPGISLTIIGEGPERFHLEENVKAFGVAGRVRFLGHLPLKQTLQVMSQASCLIHPARVAPDGNAEGTPQIILWAQAIGVPVVATNTGSIRDIVANGINGLLAEPTATSIARCTSRLLADTALQDRLRVGAGESVRKHYTSVVAQELVALYRSIVKTKVVRPESTKLHPMIAKSLRSAFDAIGVTGRDCHFAGSGGHGQVYVSLELKQPVAIKVPAYDAHEQSRWKILEHNLLREYAALKEAGGPHLPNPVLCDVHGKFLIRSYIAGESLSRAYRYVTCENRLVLVSDLIALAEDLFQRFHYSNLGAFMIRDLKPKNIIVGTGHTRAMQLVDIGGVFAESEINERRWDQSRLGTGKWCHWAPEQLLGQGERISTAVDYFALGTTVYFTMTGKWPFDNLCTDPQVALNTYSCRYEQLIRELQHDRYGLDTEHIDHLIGWLNPDPEARVRTFPSQCPQGRADITPKTMFGLESSTRNLTY